MFETYINTREKIARPHNGRAEQSSRGVPVPEPRSCCLPGVQGAGQQGEAEEDIPRL